ncbi:MAG: tripartite tricarboxylate transporter TctB family protein [Alphaproteobacteria bacterium]|nr:tripartite tricarboxylate transporter TctB family protein [Alphaproteobacteria bacterium]
MRRADIISGMVLIVFGLVMLFIVIPTQIDTAPDGFVSPSLVPNMMMILITFLAGLLIITTIRNKAKETQEDAAPPISKAELVAFLKLGSVFAIALMLYLWVAPLAAGIAIIVGSLVALGERRPFIIIVMPTLILFGIWLLFYKLLGTAIV